MPVFLSTIAHLGLSLAFILLTFLPTLIWLIFYLQEDRNPEPKGLLLGAFLAGMGMVIPALIGECIFMWILNGPCGGDLPPENPLTTISGLLPYPLFIFILLALVEEYVKYFAVYTFIIRHPAFNEPIDAMIYMITAAMGFAAFENATYVLPAVKVSIFSGLEILTVRFFGANLLHALSSAIVGYFLAKMIFSPYRHHFVALGILIAATLHALFNYFLFKNTQNITNQYQTQILAYLILLLGVMATAVFIEFEQLKRQKRSKKILTEQI